MIQIAQRTDETVEALVSVGFGQLANEEDDGSVKAIPVPDIARIHCWIKYRQIDARGHYSSFFEELLKIGGTFGIVLRSGNNATRSLNGSFSQDIVISAH
jgi:hypothetical protein